MSVNREFGLYSAVKIANVTLGHIVQGDVALRINVKLGKLVT